MSILQSNESHITINADGASKEVRFQNNGTQNMVLDSSGNVGIGTASPVTHLDIDTGTSGAHGLNLYQNSGDSGRLFFTNDTAAETWCIQQYSGKLLFKSGGSVGSSSGNAKVSIINSGYVGIGTTDPSYLLDVANSGFSFNFNPSPTDNFDQLIFETDTGDLAKFIIGYGASHSTNPHMLALKANNASGAIGFFTTSSERARIDADGLKFRGDTATANALHDYEEGAWTPTVDSLFGEGAWDTDVITGLDINFAKYTKIGEMVTLYFSGKFTGTSSENIVIPCNRTITGLPYTPYADTDDDFDGVSQQGSGTFHVYTNMGQANFATGAIMLYQSKLTLTITAVPQTTSNSNEINFVFTYRTAS